MERIWTKHYPRGIREDIGEIDFLNLYDLFNKQSNKFKDRIAFINFGREVSFEELSILVDKTASYLINELGVKPKDRIGIILPNCIQYTIIVFAALKVGAYIVQINPLSSINELAYKLKDAEVKTTFSLINSSSIISEISAEYHIENIIFVKIGDLLGSIKGTLINFYLYATGKTIVNIPGSILFADIMNHTAIEGTVYPDIDLEDIALLQYTGGTTGISKASMLTHKNIISNILQIKEFFLGTINEGDHERAIAFLPYYHIFAFTINLFLGIYNGWTSLIITDPRNVSSMVSTIKKFDFTIIIAVNTALNMLSRYNKFSELNFKNLKLTLVGGSPLLESTANKWLELTGCNALESYGTTETSPGVACNPYNINTYTGSIGIPIPSTDIKIINEDGDELGIDEIGELCIKGPQLMKGYYNMDNSKCFTSDGYFKTGDVAIINSDGFIKIVDRIKDMVIVSGFNVYSTEVEHIISKMPGISDVGVCGLANDDVGESVVAFIIKEDPNLTKEDVISYCRSYMSRYKIPKYIKFTDSLPLSNIGKILKIELRKLAIKEFSKK